MKKLRLKEKQLVQTHSYEVCVEQTLLCRDRTETQVIRFPCLSILWSTAPLTMITGEITNRNAKKDLIIGNKLTTEDRIANIYRNFINAKHTSYGIKRKKNCFSGLLAPSLPSPSGNEASPGGSSKSPRFMDSQGDHWRFKAGIGTCHRTGVAVTTEVETGPCLWWWLATKADSSLFLGGS